MNARNGEPVTDNGCCCCLFDHWLYSCIESRLLLLVQKRFFGEKANARTYYEIQVESFCIFPFHMFLWLHASSFLQPVFLQAPNEDRTKCLAGNPLVRDTCSRPLHLMNQSEPLLGFEQAKILNNKSGEYCVYAKNACCKCTNGNFCISCSYCTDYCRLLCCCKFAPDSLYLSFCRWSD